MEDVDFNQQILVQEPVDIIQEEVIQEEVIQDVVIQTLIHIDI